MHHLFSACFARLGIAPLLSALALAGCAGGNELGSGGHGGLGGSPTTGPSSSNQSNGANPTESNSGPSGPGTNVGGSGTTTNNGGGSQGGAGGTGGSGGVGATGGTGGMGGIAAAGGAGGTGGAGMSTTVGAGGSTSSAGGGGSAPTHHLVVLAAGPTSALGAAFDGLSTWTTTPLADSSSDPVGLAFDGNGLACGALKSTTNATVDFTLWTNGTWSALSQLGMDVTYTGPLMTGGAGTIDLTFQGTLSPTTRHYFYARRDTTWGVAAEPVSYMGSDSFGFDAAAVTRLGADTVIAYAGDDHDLYDQTRTGGVWQQAKGHALGNNGVGVAPAIVALSGDVADLMIVFVRTDAADQIHFTTRTINNGQPSWSAPIAVNANAFSDEAPKLAALPNGDVALVFQGQDGKGYFSRWTGAPARAWSAPVAIDANPVLSPPGIAAGVPGADAEIAFVGGGAAQHIRLTGTTLGTSIGIGGTGLTHVAIASQ